MPIGNFKTNTDISEPVESARFKKAVDMGGFGWDEDEGLFIPQSSEINYIEDPLMAAFTSKIPDE